MHLDQLRHCLDSASSARAVLFGWGLRNTERGARNLANLAEHLGLDSLTLLTTPLTRFFPRCPDPDMALNNLDRFFAQPSAPSLLPALLDNRARTLEVLL